MHCLHRQFSLSLLLSLHTYIQQLDQRISSCQSSKFKDYSHTFWSNFSNFLLKCEYEQYILLFEEGESSDYNRSGALSEVATCGVRLSVLDQSKKYREYSSILNVTIVAEHVAFFILALCVTCTVVVLQIISFAPICHQ